MITTEQFYTCKICSQETEGIPMLFGEKSGFSEQELQNNIRLPKYNLKVKLVCGHCGNFLRWKKQNQESINRANRFCEESIRLRYFNKLNL